MINTEQFNSSPLPQNSLYTATHGIVNDKGTHHTQSGTVRMRQSVRFSLT